MWANTRTEATPPRNKRCAFTTLMENNRITCIGAGRLGLSWALCVERAGFEVLAVDIFPTYVDAINAKTLRSSEPQLMEMLKKSK